MLKKCVFLIFCFATSYLSANENSSNGRYQMAISKGGTVYILDTQTGAAWKEKLQRDETTWTGAPFTWIWEQMPPLPIQELE